MLADIAFSFLGNWLGWSFPGATQVISGAADLVKAGILELTGPGRQKVTYYVSKRDQSIIWDTAVLEAGDSTPQKNPFIVTVALTAIKPHVQSEDLILDVNLMRWRFHRPLAVDELLVSDPTYRAEQRVKKSAVVSLAEDFSSHLQVSPKGEMNLRKEDGRYGPAGA